MLQVAYLKAHTAQAIAGLEKKRLPEAEAKVRRVLELDAQRKDLQARRDHIQQEANQAAKQIGALMKAGQKAEAEQAKQSAADLKAQIKPLSDEYEQVDQQLTTALYELPNLPHPSVPEGAGEADNVVVHERGQKPTLPEGHKPHWELIEDYKLIDFELGNKVTGAGFPFYTGQGARLQRALVNFFLDQAREAGYLEVQPPLLVNEASGLATGQLPDKEGQMYEIGAEGFYLIPTAEVPLTNIYRDRILEADQLPIKLAGYTPCFRREAGSWGAHVRGLNRLHQFDKVEIVQIAHPEDSYALQQAMCEHVESLLNALELPYRKLLLCGGDISFNAALCHDYEVWSAAQERWLEVSSVSNFEAFQANRLSLRLRDGKQKQLAHTLNGSALALPRIIAALLENNQGPEGIRIPAVLRPYCGFERIR